MKPLYVVHNMGRCGSVNVHKSLVDAGHEDALHIHRIQGKDVNLGVHAVEDARAEGRKIKVITLIREPVGRNLSAYWLNYVNKHKPDPSLEEFLEVYPHHVPLNWIQEQLSYWDPDFDDKFLVGLTRFQALICRGYVYFDPVLFIRTRDLTRTWETAWRSFSDDPVPPLSNYRNSNQQATAYSNFLRDIDIPLDYLDQMYQTSYTQAFFRSQEIKVLYNIWRKR